MIQYYLISEELSALFQQTIPLIQALFLVSIVLFVREFLQTKDYPKIDKALKIYLYFTPIIALLRLNETVLNSPIMLLYLPLFVLLIFVGFYAYFNGKKEAKFYLFGWSFMLVVIALLPLNKLGIIDISAYQTTLFRLAFLVEIFLFSIALAHRVKLLNEKNQATQEQLIELQQKEQSRLTKLVEEKTRDITTLLQQKEILFQELNHRVKNNLQMVLSLLKLQIEQSSSLLTKEALQTTKNRIASIAYLYENLHLKNNTYKVNTLNYFSSIIHNVETLNHKEVKVHYRIKYNLSENELFYAGLILNELATNAYKYAFVEKGELSISLEKKGEYIFMIIADDGIGFIRENQTSLGLTIVKTLIEKQLLGKMDIYSITGTKIILTWQEERRDA